MRARTRAAVAGDDAEQKLRDDEEAEEGAFKDPRPRRLPGLSGLLLLATLVVGGRWLWLNSSGSQSTPPPAAVSIGSAKADTLAARLAQVAPGNPVPETWAAKPSSNAGLPKALDGHVAPMVQTQSVADAMKKELNTCRSKEPMIDAMKCVFGLIYPAEETEAATYGLHTAHPENIYGEIPPESVAQIASELGLGKPGAVFYDLGSGVGRMVLQAHLTSEAVRAVGVEIAIPRHKIALRALQAIRNAHLDTLLPGSITPDRKVEFYAKDATELDMSDATGIYMASLYFPKEVMWSLAEKLCKLKPGTKIMTLVKFPFDTYGNRRLPKDSPMQALRLRKSFSNIAMTWSEENNVFLYEVDPEEAFPRPFDAAKATTRQLLDEVYRRAKIERGQFETLEFVDALLNTVLGLQLGSGDELCEVGSTSGWMSLFLALEGSMDRIFSITGFNGHPSEGADRETPGARARVMLEELAPGRIPWHRRTDFSAARSLEDFVHGSVDAKAKDFASQCGSASVVVLHPMRSYEEGLDALSKLAQVLPAGAVVLALGMEALKNGACTFGMLPLLKDFTEIPLSDELGLRVSVDMFAVAPQDKDVASLDVPGLSSLLESLAQVDVEQAAVQRLTAEKLSALGAPHEKVDVEKAAVAQNVLRGAIDNTRFGRLLDVLGGVSVARTGNLSFHSPTPSPKHRRHGGELPVMQLARLWVARFQGSAASAYGCLEANLYALASYAPAITKREKKAGLFPEHAAIYGEVDPRGLASVIKKLGGLKSTDKFFDLGSGLGKAVLQVYISTPVGHAVGVELSEARYKGAIEALAALRHRFPNLAGALDKGRSIELIHQDVLQAELSDATVVWMGSLAFPASLMAKIAERLLEHASVGCRVVTMIEFPEPETVQKHKLVRREVLHAEVRWTQTKEAKVYLYEIV